MSIKPLIFSELMIGENIILSKVKPVGVVPFVQDLSGKIQTFMNEYQLVIQKKNQEIVESKSEVVEHEDEIQKVEETSRVQVQDTDKQVTDEETHVEFTDMTCNESLEEPVMSLNECFIDVPVYI